MPDVRSPAGGFKASSPRLLSQAFRYAGSGMILIDGDDQVADVNIALRLLMGTDLAGCKGHGRAALSARLLSGLEGELFPPGGVARTCLPLSASGKATPGLNEAGVAETSCRYRSPDFGLAGLHAVEVPCIDPTTGELKGSLLNVEIMDLEKADTYRVALKEQWAYENVWDVYVPAYDRILPKMPFYREVVGRHLASVLGSDASRVLDIGAGTGSVTVPLLSEGCLVTAVEARRAMLEKLESKVEPAFSERLTSVEDTAERLPHLADNAYDAVTVLLAFFDMNDPPAALREAVRLLRPGGVLVVTEPKERFDVGTLTKLAERDLHASGLYEALKDDWARVMSVAPALQAQIRSHQMRARGASRRPPWHAEALRDALELQGFIGVSFIDSHYGHCATVTGTKPA